MKQLFRMIALILTVSQSQSEPNSQINSKVYYHKHPTTFYVNGIEQKKLENLKKRYSIASLTTKEFVAYYKKSKNIICL